MTEHKKYLSALEQVLDHYDFGKEPAELYDPIYYILSNGGKRLRPVLALMAYHLYKDDYQKAVKPALAIEVFHNFTLMHDDIMDNAPLRRGKETIHQKWNHNVAILSGDVMFVKAYELLLHVDKEKIHKVIASFNRCAADVCEGQQLDMNFENDTDVSEKDYLDMIRKKTAALIGFSLELGAILADAPEKDQKNLKKFGEKIGVGFQLKDDWLDVYADSQKFGKTIGGDIIANKKTFLLIKALELAKGETREKLEYWLQQPDFDKDKKVKDFISIYTSLHIKEITEQEINENNQNAFRLLNNLSASHEKLNNLIEFSKTLVNREK